MSLAIVRLYVEIALLLASGLVLFVGARAVAEKLGGPQPAQRWLVVGQTLVLLAVILPAAARAVIRPDAFFRAPVQVAATLSSGTASLSLALAPAGPGWGGPALGLGDAFLGALAAFLFASTALGLVWLARDAHRLRSVIRRAVPVRRIGRVSILVSSEVDVPFSTAAGLRAYVVLPEAFVLAPENFRLALAHELEHMRARDVAWAQAVAVLTALMPWNLAMYAWARSLGPLQELACDQRVIARRRIAAIDYGACLLWAAERVQGARASQHLAVPMFQHSRSLLRRRIDMITSPTKNAHLFWMVLVCVPALAGLAFTAAVAHGAIADRRIGATEAQAIADDLHRASGFRVPVDEVVVEEVNRVLGTAESRASFREGLVRLASYRATGEAALKKHGVPLALLAVPLAESRVQPLAADGNRMRSGSIWQFIPGTARAYGLVVEGTIDQRFDPALEADAAGRLLRDLKGRLGDWVLAIAAYNQGIGRVESVIAKSGTRDAAALVRSKALSRYCSTVLAAMLLAHRPSLVD